MGGYGKVAIIIPAFNPDGKLLCLLGELHASGFLHIIVVNDGSCKNGHLFEEAQRKWGVHLLEHSVNLGKGRAYKTALNYYIGHFPDTVGVVGCDADGQHHIDDIIKCADTLLRHPDGVALGARNFDGAGIPFRSRFGNKCTGAIFRFFCGMDIRDTQTGLRGIPYGLTKTIIEAPGERYEYETSVLFELNRMGVPIYQFGIKTIYTDGNQSSHFHPFWDSMKIYRVILKYMCSSLAAAIIDYVVFMALSGVCGNVFIPTYAGRGLSAACNFTANKKLVFKKKGDTFREAARYILLLFVSGTASAIAVSWMHSAWHLGLLPAKMAAETVLFFFNFYVQRNFVFRKRG